LRILTWVLAQWLWSYVTRNRSALLIPEEEPIYAATKNTTPDQTQGHSLQ
jgi:hypothetical protein